MDPSWALISFSQWHQRVAEANLTLSLCYRERVARHWSYSITVKNPWSLIGWKPTHTWLHRSTQLASISKHLLMEITLVLFFFKIVRYKSGEKRVYSWSWSGSALSDKKKGDQVRNYDVITVCGASEASHWSRTWRWSLTTVCSLPPGGHMSPHF